MSDFSLNELSDLLALVEDVGSAAHWRLDVKTDAVDWSPGIYRVYGLQPGTLRPDRCTTLSAFHADERDLIDECLRSAVYDREDFKLDARIIRPDGSIRYVKIAGRPFSAPSGRISAVLGVIIDVTDYKRTEHKLRRLAETDPLTGAANVRRFEALAEAELRRAGRFGKDSTLALIDIDGFKSINDTFGHGVGDDVLRTFVKTATETLREVDIIARIGGDEFAILMPETLAAEAIQPLERILANVGALNVENENVTIRLSFSGGVTQMRPDANLRELLRDADMLLYRAKRAGPNRIEVLPESDAEQRHASS